MRAILHEFNLEIQPMKLAREKGLEKLITHIEKEEGLISCSYTHEGIIFDVWYKDIVYYLLQDRFLYGMSSSKQRELRTKCDSYMLKEGHMY